MKGEDNQRAQQSEDIEISGDISVGSVILSDFSGAMAASMNGDTLNSLAVLDGSSVVSVASSYSSSYGGDPHSPLSEDFTGHPHSSPAASPDLFSSAINTQIFVTNGVINYIIDTSSFSANTIDTIIEHGWYISFPVPEEYSQINVLSDIVQIAEKLGINSEKLLYVEEPSFHELKKHSEDEGDGGGGEQHSGSLGFLPIITTSSVQTSSDQKEQSSTTTSLGASTASLALNGFFAIGAMTAIDYVGEFTLSNSASNSIIDLCKNNLQEIMDFSIIY